MKTNTKVPKTPFFAAFSVGAVLFSAHAGGGFATGNQANTYYVGLGWTGIISAVVAMLLLTLTMREAMIMYNSRGLKSYKQLFETLYHPFDKIEWAFEVFFYIMVLMAVAAAISGAASALNNYFTINYYIGVAIVGVIVLMLTIFGAGIVRAASTYMGMAILVTAISIYVIGIFKSDSSIFSVLSADFETTGFMNMPKAILNAFTRMRYVRTDGSLEFKAKMNPKDTPDLMPWFDYPRRFNKTVCFGHWSTLGLVMREDTIAIDTGCLWGGQLTCVRLPDRRLWQVRCPQWASPC